MSDLKQRLLDACLGHPHAKIPWPHRLLHEAAAEIDRLRAALEAIDNALVDAMQADCESGVAWLNDKAAAAYLKDFPATKRAIDFCISTARAEALK